MLILAFQERLIMNCYVLSAAGLYGSAGRAKRAWGWGEKNHKNIFCFPNAPFPRYWYNIDPLLSYVCLWLDSMFYSAQKSCKVGMWSLCAWKVPNASEAVGYQVRKSLSVWRPAQPVSLQAPTQPIFCLFYLLGEETSPTISLAPPFRVGWTLYVFYLYVCI